MKIKKIFYVLFLLSVLSSCHIKNTSENSFAEKTISIEYAKQDKINVSDFVDSILYVKIEEQEIGLISRIEKVVLKDHKIYIMDGFVKKLISFDLNGTMINSFGKVGDAPGEFLNITDFDLDKNNIIYIYDGTKNKILQYNQEGSFLRENKLPFKIENFHLLDNGNILFALAPYNEMDYKMQQIILTDNEFNTIEKSVFYDDNIDPSIHFPSYFVITKDNIIYNRVIDNQVYVYSLDGHLCEKINFNFVGQNIPVNKLSKMNDLMNEIGNYSFIATPPIIINDLCIFNLNHKGSFYTAFFDLHTNNFFAHSIEKSQSHDIILPMNFSTDMNEIISCYNSDILPNFENINLPADIIEHIKKGNIVLCRYKIKAKAPHKSKQTE